MVADARGEPADEEYIEHDVSSAAAHGAKASGTTIIIELPSALAEAIDALEMLKRWTNKLLWTTNCTDRTKRMRFKP